MDCKKKKKCAAYETWPRPSRAKCASLPGILCSWHLLCSLLSQEHLSRPGPGLGVQMDITTGLSRPRQIIKRPRVRVDERKKKSFSGWGDSECVRTRLSPQSPTWSEESNGEAEADRICQGGLICGGSGRGTERKDKNSFIEADS